LQSTFAFVPFSKFNYTIRKQNAGTEAYTKLELAGKPAGFRPHNTGIP